MKKFMVIIATIIITLAFASNTKANGLDMEFTNTETIKLDTIIHDELNNNQKIINYVFTGGTEGTIKHQVENSNSKAEFAVNLYAELKDGSYYKVTDHNSSSFYTLEGEIRINSYYDSFLRLRLDTNDHFTGKYVYQIKNLKPSITATLQTKISFVSGTFDNHNPYLFTRIGGADRFDVEKKFNEGITDQSKDAVLLTSGLKYPDALTGSILNNSLHSTLLLITERQDIIDRKIQETKRILKPGGTVYILGGASTVSQNIEDQFKKHFKVERIAGADRLDVALNIAEIANPKPTSIFLAYGLVFSDSLSVVPAATDMNSPILLQWGENLIPRIEDYIKANPSIKEVNIVSGTGVIPTSVETELKTLGIETVNRYAGKDRFETSLEIAKKFYPNAKRAAVANGFVFADALSGSLYAYKAEMPILLIGKDYIPTDTSTYLKSKDLSNIFLYGGEATVPNKVVTDYY